MASVYNPLALTNTKPFCELPTSGKLIFKNAMTGKFDKTINLNILINDQVIDTFRFDQYSSNGIPNSGIISFYVKGNFKSLLLPPNCNSAKIEITNPQLIKTNFIVNINMEIELDDF